MFHWSHKGIHVALSSEEEYALVCEVASDSSERFTYFTSPGVRKKITNLIFKYLEEALEDNFTAFQARFVKRVCKEEAAQKVLPAFLDAYGRITKRATIRHFGEDSAFELVMDGVDCYTDDKGQFQVLLLAPTVWPWRSPKVLGHVFLPAESVRVLMGTVEHFFVVTSTVGLEFHRDYVQVSALKERVKQIDSEDLDPNAGVDE